MKLIAIKDMSAGNETIGETWKETKIFDHTDQLIDVMKWVGIKKNVVITIPDDGVDEFIKIEDKMPF